jgi:hypothetical protein
LAVHCAGQQSATTKRVAFVSPSIKVGDGWLSASRLTRDCCPPSRTFLATQAIGIEVLMPKVRHPSLHPSLRRSISSAAETTMLAGTFAAIWMSVGGSMKIDRDVMELARSRLSVEQIAAKLKLQPNSDQDWAALGHLLPADTQAGPTAEDKVKMRFAADRPNTALA